MDRMTAALPWTVKVLHRSSEVRIVDARGRLVAIVKTKVYRIGTSTDPTTTFTLPRAGVWVGTVSLM